MEMKIELDLSRIIVSTITILLIVGIIKLILWIFKAIMKFFDTLIHIPARLIGYKDNDWNDIDRIVLHTKARIQFPRSQFQPNSMYYDAFMRNPYNEINTKNIVINLLEYTGYQGLIPNIKYIQPQNGISEHSTYIKEQPVNIFITDNPETTSIDLLALIIHECMYVYRTYYRIEYGDGFNQKNVSDILAVYLGFYNNLTKAHKFYTKQKDLDYAYKRIHK